jgi:hypothetical protein
LVYPGIIFNKNQLWISIVDAALLGYITVFANVDTSPPMHFHTPGIQRAEK